MDDKQRLDQLLTEASILIEAQEDNNIKTFLGGGILLKA
jgi:hypothetical protein